MVPFLYFVYESVGPNWGWLVAPELEATVAHATSLIVIVPTAVVGTWAYARAGRVSWRAALPIAFFSILGGIGGARLAILLPAELLKLGFGIFVMASAVNLVVRKPSAEERPLRLSLWVTVPTGLCVGLFSALMGVGGGLVAIPLLLHLVGLPIEKVAATSLAIIVFAATAGTLTYMASGAGQAGLPVGTVGYVHVPAALPLMVGSVISVRLGALVNQRMNVTLLRRVIAAFLFVLGARLVLQSAGIG